MSDGVTTDAWERLSGRYDRQLWLERCAVGTALDLLAATADERTLDVGTGTGEVLRQLASRPARPREAIGVDTSPAMLARVGALPACWSVQVADARALPFADAEFDVASASYLLQVVADADRALVLAELRRVLRPGGRLVTVTPAIPDAGLARRLARVFDQLAARRPDRYGGLRALDPRVALPPEGFTVMEARWNVRGYPSLCVLARRL
ncbi:MAG: class I SAM-dependent methyltransferase [Thermoleophilaceae bacterium]|nr:class I SAM-dependent methyltransferase [Thermoleophilaceae bacterium]